jgi:hypothetical protein
MAAPPKHSLGFSRCDMCGRAAQVFVVQNKESSKAGRAFYKCGANRGCGSLKLDPVVDASIKMYDPMPHTADEDVPASGVKWWGTAGRVEQA